MRIDLYCFPSKLERQPSKCQNFEAQSHSLFSRCLRLATAITDSHPRLATGGWLDLTRQAFHLLDYSPLSGRTIPILMSLLYHNDTIIKKEKELLRALLIQFCKLEFLDAYNMRKKLNFILNIVLSFTAIL